MDEQPPPKRVKLRNDGFPGVSSDSGECCNFMQFFVSTEKSKKINRFRDRQMLTQKNNMIESIVKFRVVNLRENADRKKSSRKLIKMVKLHSSKD